jgi:hypothetical protein
LKARPIEYAHLGWVLLFQEDRCRFVNDARETRLSREDPGEAGRARPGKNFKAALFPR